MSVRLFIFELLSQFLGYFYKAWHADIFLKCRNGPDRITIIYIGLIYDLIEILFHKSVKGARRSFNVN